MPDGSADGPRTGVPSLVNLSILIENGRLIALGSPSGWPKLLNSNEERPFNKELRYDLRLVFAAARNILRVERA
jgi:hypothetical protein